MFQMMLVALPVNELLTDSIDGLHVLLGISWLHHNLIHGTSEILPLFPLPVNKSGLS